MRCTPRETVLIDKRNIAQWFALLVAEFSVPDQLNGFDLETEDSRRHEGLNRAMNVGEDGHKSAAKKLLFDVNRTTITGFSMSAKGSTRAYYFNMAHADVENRLTFDQVEPILEAAKENGTWVAHKAPFELCMTYKCWGWTLGDKVICTLQLAVTCFNDDTYPLEEFLKPGFGDGFLVLLPAIRREFHGWEAGQEMTQAQEELLFKFTAKTSDAAHSYNGFVNSIKYGYGLKRLSKYFLGYEQKTFAETLDGKAHMGQLTGEEVASYGADDAWVCLDLYFVLMDFLINTNPKAVHTFFNQENPMIHHYAAVWAEGVVLNGEQVVKQKGLQRIKAAGLLRTMKKRVASLLPFPAEPHEKMLKYDAKLWGKSWNTYRTKVKRWAEMPDGRNDFAELMQTKTALSSQWAGELQLPESTGLSITYYQVIRSILYDLCGCSFQLEEGKVASNAEAQKTMAVRLAKKAGIKIDEDNTLRPIGEYEPSRELTILHLIADFQQLSGSNQVMKLFINKYLNLRDPDTGRVYPILSSQLNSRRMAMEEPNTTQLVKFGENNFVRAFFEPDEEDHVVLTADWSAVELVLIGEASGDPTFKKAYGQIPHDDIHSETGAALLDQTVEEFKLRPDKKQVRNDLGKPANFSYWYSGALGTIAKTLAWDSETMWSFVEKYRAKYAVAEAWRVGTISQTRLDGYIDLPDGNRRYRYESTGLWASQMQDKFNQFGPVVAQYGAACIKKIQNRSGNQAVNSYIQGGCATLAKRSMLRMNSVIHEKHYRARLMFVVHDELVYSVHKDDAVLFGYDLSLVMRSHEDIVKTLKLDVAVAVGRNYLAWHPESNPRGQIELDEASKVPCLEEKFWGKKLEAAERQKVVEWLFQN